jgi:phage gp29-like protein
MQDDPARNRLPQVAQTTSTVNPHYPDGPENGLLPPKDDLTDIDQSRLGELGQSGTLISGGGFISFEEYNKDLEGRKGLRMFDQMRKSDATVMQSLKAVKQPIMSAVYSIEPATDDPYDQMVAAFVKKNLMEGEVNFYHFLREALTMLDFGFSLAEIVMDFDEWEGYTHEEQELVPGELDPTTGITAPGEVKTTETVFPGGQYLMLKKLAFRRQLTVYRWQTEAQKAGITQTTYTGGFFSIPEDKIALFVNEQEGDNFQGVSLLRPAYKHWFFKETLYKIQAMALQRQGMGIPQLTAPEDADEISKQKAREALKNIRANESSYIEIPKGYIIDFMDMKGMSVIDASHAIEHHDKKILSNVLAGFLDLGSGHSGGSRALSEDLSRLFTQSLETIVRNFCEVVNNQIIKRLVDYNFNVDAYPKLESGSLSDDDINLLADALGKLSNADLLTPDPELEDFVRTTFKLPALPDDIKENYNNRARSQAGTVPDPKDPNSEDNASGNDVDADDILASAAKLQKRIGKRIDAIKRAG